MKPFPVDDTTLNMVETALEAALDFDDSGEPYLARGEYTLNRLLDMMSGPSNETLIDNFGGTPVYYRHEPVYTEHSVIQALIDEVRRLRACIDNSNG